MGKVSLMQRCTSGIVWLLVGLVQAHKYVPGVIRRAALCCNGNTVPIVGNVTRMLFFIPKETCAPSLSRDKIYPSSSWLANRVCSLADRQGGKWSPSHVVHCRASRVHGPPSAGLHTLVFWMRLLRQNSSTSSPQAASWEQPAFQLGADESQ